MTKAPEIKPEPKPETKGRDRSPSFPFVPLQTAIERLVAFEAYFGRHPGPIDKAGLAWDMKASSSQAYSTLAALKSYGLIEYQGAGNERTAVLSEDGRNYLRAQQDSIKREILKRAALRPKQMAIYWGRWGADRPPDPICLDNLIMKDGFSDNGAPIFLKVYDSTIAYAGLTAADKDAIVLESFPEQEGELIADSTLKPPGVDKKPIVKSPLMQPERELTKGLLSKEASFRLIVSGRIGAAEIDMLIKKLELDRGILAAADPESENEPTPN